MSKEECFEFLQSHPGEHILPEIAEATGNNLESARKFLRRLGKDGLAKRDYPRASNIFIKWWV